MSGRLGPLSYVSAVLAMFSIIFHCSALGDFKRVIRKDKKKNMKNTNGEKNLISVIIVKSIQARRAPEWLRLPVRLINACYVVAWR